MKPEVQKTFKVAVTLCLVCSIVVSSLAVGLAGIQAKQKERFRQQSILEAAGLWEDSEDPGELYAALINPVVVDLQTKAVSDRYEADDKQLELATLLRDPEMYDLMTQEQDVAGIAKREAYTVVYEVREGNKKTGTLQTIVLPIRGRGLWSTLYGFIALDMTAAADGSASLKVAGLTYYKHGETPGLGGEVDNQRWKKSWRGKLVFDDSWNVQVEVAKNASSDYQVDALSGATLTSNGVTNMLKFWLGEDGFGPYLKSVAADAGTSAGTAGETPASESDETPTDA